MNAISKLPTQSVLIIYKFVGNLIHRIISVLIQMKVYIETFKVFSLYRIEFIFSSSKNHISAPSLLCTMDHRLDQ